MIRIVLVVVLLGLGVVTVRAADPPTPVRVSVLKFGTVSWELDVMQHHGLAAREGVDVRVTQLASPGAATVAPDAAPPSGVTSAGGTSVSVEASCAVEGETVAASAA